MKLTVKQLDAICYALGAFRYGSPDDCGGDKRLFARICEAHTKACADLNRRKLRQAAKEGNPHS